MIKIRLVKRKSWHTAVPLHNINESSAIPEWCYLQFLNLEGLHILCKNNNNSFNNKQNSNYNGGA